MFTQGNLSTQFINIYMSAQYMRQSKRLRQDVDAKYRPLRQQGNKQHLQFTSHHRHFAWRCYLLMKCVQQEKDLLRAARDRKRRGTLNFQVAQQ